MSVENRKCSLVTILYYVTHFVVKRGTTKLSMEEELKLINENR